MKETVGRRDEREAEGREGYCSLSHHIAMVVVSRTDQIDTHTNRQRAALQAVDTPISSQACLYTNNDGIHLVIAVFFYVRSRNRTIVFFTQYSHVMHVQDRCWYRSIFSVTDTEPIPAVSADT